jgi:hypothetical protein
MAVLAHSDSARRLGRLALGLLVVLLRPSSAFAFEEHEVKAAFIFNFAKFIAWPKPAAFAARERFVFCLVGDDAVGDALSELVRAKTLHGVAVEVRRGGTLDEIGDCDVLFLSVGSGERPEAVIKQARAAPVLTVSDAAGFARRGGMVELFLEGQRVRFAINVKAVRAAGLEPSSKLLALARIVDH